jgi:hypothetical protein
MRNYKRSAEFSDFMSMRVWDGMGNPPCRFIKDWGIGFFWLSCLRRLISLQTYRLVITVGNALAVSLRVRRKRSRHARRCISYLTIEHKSAIPEEFRKAIGDRIYGCDVCLDACSWNRFVSQSGEITFHARTKVFEHWLRSFLDLDSDGCGTLFAKLPINRINRSRFLRNVCAALGNVGNLEDSSAVQSAAADPDPLIAEHASWGVNWITERLGS